MDRIQTILLCAFQYENTQIAPIANDKAPTWWPYIVREYDPKKWATSPDPDSYPVDGVNNLVKLGNREIYDYVEDKIMPLLTSEEKKIIYIFLGKGYVETLKKASRLLCLNPKEAINKYEKILLKIKKSLPEYEIFIYFLKV